MLLSSGGLYQERELPLADVHSKKIRSYNMSRIKGRDTKPELIIRKWLYSLGYRYRLHEKILSGKPDIVFKKLKKAIFVHGCFWHQHNDPTCPLVAKPKTNKKFWNEKLNKNVERDKRNVLELEQEGWKVLTIWECEIKDLNALKKKILNFIN